MTQEREPQTSQPSSPPPAPQVQDPQPLRSLLALRERYNDFMRVPVHRTISFFVLLLAAAIFLVMLGRRNDAITQAQIFKAGILNTHKVNVAFENVGGKLIKRHVSEGQYVSAGTLLASLDEIDFRLSVNNLSAQLENIEAQISYLENNIRILQNNYNLTASATYKQVGSAYASLLAARTQYDEAERNYERYARLVRDRAVSKSNFDNARTQYENARSARTAAQNTFDSLTLGADSEQLRLYYEDQDASRLTLDSLSIEYLKVENEKNSLSQLQAGKKQLQVQLEEAQLSLRRSSIYAPVDGYINDLIYEEGEMVSPNAPMVVLESLDMYFDVYLPEYDITRYAAGQKISVHVVALDKDIEGTVRYVNEAPDTAVMRMTREQGQADLNAFVMRVDVRNDDQDLVPGITMEIEQ